MKSTSFVTLAGYMIGTILLVLFLASCMKRGFKPISEGQSRAPSIGGGEESDDREITPFSKGRIVSNCLGASVRGANACIFRKNPVADEGRVLSNPPVINAGSFRDRRTNSTCGFALCGLTDVSDFQTYAVHIPGDKLANNDFIVNDDLIEGRTGSRVRRTANNDWKHPFHEDPNLSMVKAHTFFWVNHLARSIRDLTGGFYAGGKTIGVLPVLAILQDELVINAFWSDRFNIIAFGVSSPLGRDQQGSSVHIPIGLDSGVIAHEAGHALLDYASDAPIGPNPTLEDNECGLFGFSTCSKELVGSPRAIHEGVGDILTVFLFPDSTSVGELFDNNPDGLVHCSTPRDVKKIKAQKLRARDLFSACPSTKGEIHALGSVYSTIWYGVFQKALERGGEKEREESYQLFFEHLKNVTTNDTFETMREAIKILDENLFSGRFSEDLDAEYQLMGYDDT